jgi:phosphopantothenoylcysteine synthetase/decarboxylase
VEPDEKTGRGNDLRILICGSGAAPEAGTLVAAALARGWAVDVTATEAGAALADPGDLHRLLGRPPRTTYEYAPDGTRVSPRSDALIICPATYNTITKLSLGIADTYALSSVAEVIGRGVPTVIVPSVNPALRSRAPYRRAVASLQEEGVLFAPDPAAALDLLTITKRTA